jgi:putative ABC transport system ATP-binding protein
LFTGTVAENIAYGDMDSEVDMMEIERAARLSNSEEFILKLPNGFHTNLGDRASSLSGGQRQRLAIARAIYQKASILILDEATSALDNNSEKLVREALEHLMVGHTVSVTTFLYKPKTLGEQPSLEHVNCKV